MTAEGKQVRHGKRSKGSALWIGGGAFFLLFLFLTDTNGVAEGCLAALQVFARGVLPATFPYLLLSEIIVSSGFAGTLGRKCGKMLGRLFDLPPAAVSVILMGLISGFPVGAKSASDLYLAGYIDKSDAERLAAFTNFCGPPFLLLTVGQGLLGDVRAGLLLYLCQSAVSLLFGMIYRRSFKKKGRIQENFLPLAPKRTLSRLFTDAVAGAAPAALRILGYLLFFAAICRIAGDGFALLQPILPKAAAPILQTVHTAFSAFLEISAGCNALHDLSVSPPVLLFAAALATGWAGVSVALQVAGFLKDAGLSMKGYLWAHTLCPLITAILSSVLYAMLFRG